MCLFCKFWISLVLFNWVKRRVYFWRFPELKINVFSDPSNEQKYPLDDIIYINLEEEIDIEKQLNRMKARKEAKKASKV